MTAGHCVYSHSGTGGIWAQSIEVIPGMNERIEAFWFCQRHIRLKASKVGQGKKSALPMIMAASYFRSPHPSGKKEGWFGFSETV